MARRFLIMVGVLLLGTALRLFALDQVPPGLSHDEAYIGATALEVWLLGRRDIFFQIYNGIEPLIVYWQAIYLRLFGITPVAMRLVNVTAGLLTIALTYAITRRLLATSEQPLARWGATLAALGVSLSFWAIFVSRLALRSVTLPLLAIPALYCLWRGLIADSRISPSRRWACYALGGAWLGAAMYTYLSSRFLPFVPLIFFGYWLLRGQVRRHHWLGMGLFLGTWALVFAPLGLFYWQHPDVFGQRASQVLNLPVALAGDPRPLITSILRTLGSFSLVGPGSSRYGLAGRPIFEPVGAIFFCLGVLTALARLRRPPRQAAPYAFLLIWWLVMLVPDFITGESPHYLRTIGALPPTYIFWAIGIICAGSWLATRLARTSQTPGPFAKAIFWWPVAVGLYVVASGGLAAYDYFGRWSADAEARAIYGAEFTEVADYLKSSELNGPVVLSAAYYRDWDRFRLDLQMHHHPPFVIWFDGRQTLLLPPTGSGLDPPYIFTRSAPPHTHWMGFLVAETQGTDMTVYRLRSDARPTLATPLSVTIGDRLDETGIQYEVLQLLGYQIEGQPRAGDTLPILLHWQPLRDVPGDPDYAFFAHLRDRRGYTWAQVDASGYAAVDWQPGVQVLQWLALPLPPDLPPLDYMLVVGAEDRSPARPLPVLGKPDTTAVELGTLTPATAATAPLPDEFQVPNASNIDAGGIFTLRGYSLSSRWRQPGDTIHISLFWQAQTAPSQDYWLDTWLISQAGERFGVASHQPLDGDYPTSLWQADQWVRDRYDLTLPTGLSGGPYQLYVGWRDSSGVRLTSPNGPGVALGTILISPPDNSG